MHRFLWDMHYAPLPDGEPDFPMSAEYRDTPATATSPWALPGDYVVVLTVNGKSLARPLTVKMDPRIKASVDELREQFDLSQQLYQLRQTLAPVRRSFEEVSEQFLKLKARAAERPALVGALAAFAQKLEPFGPPNPRPNAPPSFFILDSAEALFNEIQAADAAPGTAVTEAVTDLKNKSGSQARAWQNLLDHDLPALNQQLKTAGFPEMKTKL